MPQYTIKIHTYDPAIIEAFERLRKNRKQAAFTHEALKHFLSSERGARVVALMGGEDVTSSPESLTGMAEHFPADEQKQKSRAILSPRSGRDASSNVLDSILK